MQEDMDMMIQQAIDGCDALESFLHYFFKAYLCMSHLGKQNHALFRD